MTDNVWSDEENQGLAMLLYIIGIITLPMFGIGLFFIMWGRKVRKQGAKDGE